MNVCCPAVIAAANAVGVDVAAVLDDPAAAETLFHAVRRKIGALRLLLARVDLAAALHDLRL